MKLTSLDLGILSELMKEAKMSDREVAERLRVSQPTVTRRRKRLEKAGIVREYTAIPDFQRVGYHIMAITLLKYSWMLRAMGKSSWMFARGILKSQSKAHVSWLWRSAAWASGTTA